MKLTAFAIASVLLIAALPPAQAQTASQHQNQLNAALCTNNWTEALSVVRMLIGSQQTTPEYRQQLVVFRDQLEGYRAANAQFDRSSEPNCAAAIASVPQAVTLRAPNRQLDWEQAAAAFSRPSAPAPSTAVAAAPVAAPAPLAIAAPPPINSNRQSSEDLTGGVAFAESYCQARRTGLTDEEATAVGVQAAETYLNNRYGSSGATEYLQTIGPDRLIQDFASALIDQCPEIVLQ